MGPGGGEVVLTPLSRILRCPGESGSGALPSGVPKEGAVGDAHSAHHRCPPLGSTAIGAPQVIVGGSSALPSFTRAWAHCGVRPPLDVGALDGGSVEGPCVGATAREGMPTAGDVESPEPGVGEASAAMQGQTGCSQQPGLGNTASAAQGSVPDSNAEGRPPPATVEPQGSCEQEPSRLAYSAYRGGAQKWGRRAREGPDAEAPARKRVGSGQKRVGFSDSSREEAVAFLDSCCEPKLAQGVDADTVEMQAQVQASLVCSCEPQCEPAWSVTPHGSHGYACEVVYRWERDGRSITPAQRKHCPEVAQGVDADTAEMQAQVQAIRGSWKYRNAGLSYAAARAVVVMQQQSEEARRRREV